MAGEMRCGKAHACRDVTSGRRGLWGSCKTELPRSWRSPAASTDRSSPVAKHPPHDPHSSRERDKLAWLVCLASSRAVGQ